VHGAPCVSNDSLENNYSALRLENYNDSKWISFSFAANHMSLAVLNL
jgi:hypothetical protein